MPQLPQVEQQLTPNPSRRVIDGVRAPVNDSVGKAVMQLGDEFTEIAGRVQKSNDDREMITADRIARERLDRLKFDLEHNEPETPDAAIKDRWRQESTQIITEAAAGLTNGQARSLWTERAKGWQADGAIWSETLGLKRSVDRARGAHITAEADLEKKAGDLAISHETFAASIAGQKAAILRDTERGIFDKATAAERVAALDKVLEKDRFSRARAEVERLVTAGKADDAKKLIDDFGGDVEQGRALRQAREGAEQDVRAAANRAEKEKRDAEILASNTFEMGLLKGEAGHSYRDLDRMVETGVISLNDAPQLRRSIRAEQDRAKAEAESSKLSSAQKEYMKDRSSDYRLVFDAVSMTDPAGFLQGYDKWDDSLKARYNVMTPDDQRAVDRKLLEMSVKGQTSGATKEYYDVLLAEAKRVVPDFEIGSTAKKADPRGKEFAGKLARAAETISKEGGGTPLTVQQARDVVARALANYEPGKWDNLATNQADNPNSTVNARLRAAVDPNYDYQAEQQIRDAYYEKFGRSIPDDELKRYYAAAKAGK